ncbi:hypothetical protein [Actinocorallia longicatena]|uniref:DUF3618 domain-containing protein n=1 Tax=Actinocorallia longicatena TaxID=111803 RepID=A0ABP6Q8E4_9ACTN
MNETKTQETTHDTAAQVKAGAAEFKDKITAPEAAPARRRAGAGAGALAVGAAGVWALRKYRSGLAARRRKMAARKHFKVIGREAGAVLRLAGEAFGDRTKQGADVARKQAASGAKTARKQARAQVGRARAKVRR